MMKCRECGSEMKYHIDGHTCNWTCPKCGWGLATSYFSPIELDQTTYTLRIGNVSSPSINMIKCVAGILSCNSMEAKGILESGSGSIEGKAQAVLNIVQSLTEADIPYRITPEFPYTI